MANRASQRFENLMPGRVYKAKQVGKVSTCQQVALWRNWHLNFEDEIFLCWRTVHCTGSKFGWGVEGDKPSILTKFQDANVSHCDVIDVRSLKMENSSS